MGIYELGNKKTLEPKNIDMKYVTREEGNEVHYPSKRPITSNRILTAAELREEIENLKIGLGIVDEDGIETIPDQETKEERGNDFFKMINSDAAIKTAVEIEFAKIMASVHGK